MTLHVFPQYSVSSVNHFHLLKQGDKIPDYELVHLINYPAKSEVLSKFRGKLLILDFWDTYCSACINSWPKLLKLQEHFKDSIQIILVNPWQSEAVVRDCFRTRKKLANIKMTLPTICGDTVLLQLFPVSGLPYIVWIDGKGYLKLYTSGTSLTERNISAILDKKDLPIPQAIGNENLITDDFTQPLFVNGNGGHVNKVLWQSILTKGEDSLFPDYGIRHYDTIGFKARCINCYLSRLYLLAYGRKLNSMGYVDGGLQNRIHWEVKDFINYLEPTNGEAVFNKDLYIYSMTTPPIGFDSVQVIMQADLKRYFGFEAKWIKETSTCMVLEAKDTGKINYRRGDSILKIENEGLHLNKVKVSSLIASLEDAIGLFHYSPYPLVDATGLTGLLGEIFIKTNMENLNSLNDALKQYGLHFTIKDQEIDRLLINDIKYRETYGR
jgi:thiol-disulfide isomerase/thioredoxin